MMTKAKFILTAFVIVVATLWGTASRQMRSSVPPGSGSMGNFQPLQLEGTRTGTGTEQPLIGSMGTTTRCQLHRLFQFPML